MPRACTVCQHREREAIDTALVAGKESLRTSAGRFGLSASALRRHKARHLPLALLRAGEAQDVARGTKLRSQVPELQAEAQTMLAQGKAAGAPRTALAAIDRQARMLELETKFLDKLGDDAPEQASTTVKYICEWRNEDGEFIGETTS